MVIFVGFFFASSSKKKKRRGLTPPQRVKSISMATFTTEEVDFIRAHGNEDCAKTWMGLWDPKRTITQDHRELMVDKYERKRLVRIS